MNSSHTITEYCLKKFSFDEKMADEYYYSCLPLCVVDTVFSIGVRYEGVKNVINNVCDFLNIHKLRDDKSKMPNTEKQVSISDFLKKIENKTTDDLANEVFKNKQRTSTSSGILKAEAVVHFLKVCKEFKLEFLQDVNALSDIEGFETAIKSIKGQSSGISLKYFYMLAGSEDIIKPDRMVLRFLNEATGSKTSQIDAQKLLFDTAAEISVQLNRKISALYLDYTIWLYQRGS